MTQVLRQKEAVVRAHQPHQVPLQFLPLLPQASLGQSGQRRRIGLPRQEGFQHRPCRRTGDVGDHAGHLEVGILQGLLYPLHDAGPLLCQAHAVTRQFPEFPLRLELDWDPRSRSPTGYRTTLVPGRRRRAKSHPTRNALTPAPPRPTAQMYHCVQGDGDR
ncbi:MAG: hypothetical protein Q8O76_02610 [Chloroflexota bacterium]|nr:hypothetical protein [Chloroflexota bacterium]